MAKRPTTKQPASQSQAPTNSWGVYRIRGTPAQFIGIVYNQPDERSAIMQAIQEFKVPVNQRNRLLARRRD